jgi:hypothetical protein
MGKHHAIQAGNRNGGRKSRNQSYTCARRDAAELHPFRRENSSFLYEPPYGHFRSPAYVFLKHNMKIVLPFSPVKTLTTGGHSEKCAPGCYLLIGRAPGMCVCLVSEERSE